MDVSLSAGISVAGIEFWPDEYPLPAANARAMSFPLASLFGAPVNVAMFWPDAYPLPLANARAIEDASSADTATAGSGSLAAAWPTMRTHYLSVGNLVFGMHDD